MKRTPKRCAEGDDTASREIDRIWAEEAERRDREIDSGRAVLIPGESVFEKILALYSKG